MPGIYPEFTRNIAVLVITPRVVYLKQTRNLPGTFRLNNRFLPVIYLLFNRNILAISWQYPGNIPAIFWQYSGNIPDKYRVNNYSLWSYSIEQHY